MQKPILIDLDGVLRIGNEPVKDLIQFIDFLNKSNGKCCILSNSSLSTSHDVYDFFKENSININFPIITAVDAAADYVKEKYKKVAIYLSENVLANFTDILEFENPEAVLIGDIGNLWNYKLMQTIFEYIQNGADLVAIHKNKYWSNPPYGIQLDAGPFIHAIEYAVSKNAALIGKPSPIYFQSALTRINCQITDSFIMIGDDLESDIKGAKQLNAETILVLTGKTKPPISSEHINNIDYQANSLIDAISILKNL
ncbi:MAG: HAD-IIA family hydrolase [Ignavibacteriales bacterium]|nr:HAD-IIA family hydrolase [Ignavibacteriales bacterium]